MLCRKVVSIIRMEATVNCTKMTHRPVFAAKEVRTAKSTDPQIEILKEKSFRTILLQLLKVLRHSISKT